MIPASADFTINNDQIEQAKRERDRHESIIANSQRRIAALDHFLSAAAILGANVGDGQASGPPAISPATDEEPADSGSTNLMGILAQIANESPRPVSKAMMKIKLKQAGVSHDRVHGSYFYVAVDRLKKKGRITVLEDGTLWKANR